MRLKLVTKHSKMHLKILVSLLFTGAILSFTGFSQSYFLDLDSKTQTITFGKMDPINKRKFEKTIFEEKIDSSNLNELVEAISHNISVNKGEAQMIHIHGMWGGKEKFMAGNVLAFEEEILSNDSLNFGNMIFIIWDSESNNYQKNQKNAMNSLNLLGLALESLHLAIPETTFSIQCHSMGAYILTHLLHEQEGKIPKFHQLLFYAPDISQAEFDSTLNLYNQYFHHIAIFYHQKDVALKISKRKNKAERLGRNPKLTESANVDLINCTDMKNCNLAGKLTRHLYYRYSREVKNEILERLAR